jgi:hypothetical protein
MQKRGESAKQRGLGTSPFSFLGFITPGVSIKYAGGSS